METDLLGRRITTKKEIRETRQQLEIKLNEVLNEHYRTSQFSRDELVFEVSDREIYKISLTPIIMGHKLVYKEDIKDIEHSES